MVGPLRYPLFGPEVLDLPADLTERRLTIGALAMEKLLKRGLDGGISVNGLHYNMSSPFSDSGLRGFSGLRKPILRRPDRISHGIPAISIDIDHERGLETVLTHELLKESGGLILIFRVAFERS